MRKVWLNQRRVRPQLIVNSRRVNRLLQVVAEQQRPDDRRGHRSRDLRAAC